MKNKKLVSAILILLVIVIVFSWAVFGKKYNLQLLTKFTIPGITLNPNHRVLDGYAVSFALSDSLIYVTDASDTTHTKSYCYSYSGEPYNQFQFPADKGYGEVFVDKNLYYLPQSNLLAYVFWQNKQIDYYSTDGMHIRTDFPFDDQNDIINLVEYDHKIYYTSMSASKKKPRKSMALMQLHQEQPDQAPKELKNVDITQESINKHFSYRSLMLDDNSKDAMLLLENQFDKPHASLYRNNTTTEFEIKAPRVFSIYFMDKLPLQVDKGLSKEPYQLVLGQDFLIIGSWRKLNREYPLVQRIYNLKGHYLGKLKFKDDPQNELIDIIDDRLVAFNPAKGIVSIYSISLK